MTRTDDAPLDRDRIVAAALDVVSAEGLAALSMRRVARQLGTAPMSLYRHVGSKDELVGLVAAALVSRLPAVEPSRPWREVLTVTFTSLRELLDEHPGIADYLSAEAVVTPATLHTTETALDALHRAGLDPAQSARAFTTLWTFTVGSVLVERSLFAAPGEEAAAQRKRLLEALGAVSDYPRFAAVAPHWLGAEPGTLFETGLGVLLDAFEAGAVPR